MRIRTTLTILFLQAALPCIGFGAAAESSGRQACLLPWEMIAEKVRQGSRFCGSKDLQDSMISASPSNRIGRIDPNCSYAYQTNQVVTIELPAGTAIINSPQKINVDIARWVESSWQEIGEAGASLEPNEIKIPDGIEEEGFFRLSFGLKSQDGGLSHFETCAIVCSNWKKDILSFCRKLKEEIELEPDAQLIRHSVAVSHFDHTMEMVSQAPFLSGKILKALADAMQSTKALDDGQCPDFVVGLNKLRFKRFEGAEFAEFVLHFPGDYDSSQKWPVIIHIGGTRVNAVYQRLHSDWSNGNPLYEKRLYLRWSSVTHKDMRWKDYSFLMEMIRKKYNIDNDRVYLVGSCGTGMAVIALALNHPDEWAECVSFTGNSFRNLAGNALNLPIKFCNVHPNLAELTAYFQFAVNCFKYNNCRRLECMDPSVFRRRDVWDTPQSIRISSPKRIQYTIESLQSPKAYWMTVLGREDENYVSRIEASVDGQEIILKRNNIDAYQIDLRLAPLDHTRPMKIIDNEKSIAVDPKEVFTYRGSKYDQAAYVKNRQLHGPICDAFTDAYTVLYTTGIDAKETEQIGVIAKQIAGTGPCLPEDELSDEIIQNHNLILVGRAGRCQFLSKIPDSLPVQIGKSEIVFEDQTVTGDVGLMMVYPNPTNPKRYIAFILGGSSRAIKNLPVIWENDLKKAQADIAIFKVSSDDEHEFIRLEKFSTVWDWHEHCSQPLATLSKQHPKWRWRQWIGHVVRTQLDADIAVCEEVFKGVKKPNHERITLRDLNLILKNQWFVKIKLNGKELKTLLTRHLAAKDLSGSKAIKPVIDGVSFVKGMAGSGYMHVSQIKEDQYYMVALPEKLVNGSRIGVILKDYEIVGDGYLIQLIQDCLKSRKNLELDSELKKMKLTIM